MGYNDFNFLIFNYNNYINISNLFYNYFYNDFLRIYHYYSGLFFGFKSWNTDPWLFFFIPIFYLTLFLSNNLYTFLVFKLIFYFIKYLLLYLFYFIDFLSFKFFNILNIHNKYILYFFSFLYNCTIKFSYYIYRLIFVLLPGIIHLNGIYLIINNIKWYGLIFMHRILDILEWFIYIIKCKPYLPYIWKIKTFWLFLCYYPKWCYSLLYSIYKNRYYLFLQPIKVIIPEKIHYITLFFFKIKLNLLFISFYKNYIIHFFKYLYKLDFTYFLLNLSLIRKSIHLTFSNNIHLIYFTIKKKYIIFFLLFFIISKK